MNYAVSIICMVGSLTSKESSVTLPVALLFIAFLFQWSEDPGGFRIPQILAHLKGAVKDAAVPLGFLIAYLSFVVGWLGAGRVAASTLFERPKAVDVSGGYHFVLDSAVLENLYYAVSWAFNVPVGWHGQYLGLDLWMIMFAVGFAFIAGGPRTTFSRLRNGINGPWIGGRGMDC